jgi:hypothetical protein
MLGFLIILPSGTCCKLVGSVAQMVQDWCKFYLSKPGETPSSIATSGRAAEKSLQPRAMLNHSDSDFGLEHLKMHWPFPLFQMRVGFRQLATSVNERV